MITIQKYDNIQNALPKLQKVLLDAIQSDFLEIRSVHVNCEKYQKACEMNQDLGEARYVVYSQYIKKSEHKYEEFIFLDREGHEICHVSGKNMELYGILDPCVELIESQEYQDLKHLHLSHDYQEFSKYSH